MRFITFILSLITVLFLSACHPKPNLYDQTINSWQGSQITKLTAIWGEADYVRKLPNDHKIYEYTFGHSHLVHGTYHPGNEEQQGYYAPGFDYTNYCKVWLETDKSGKIINIQNDGRDCRIINKKLAKKYENPHKS